MAKLKPMKDVKKKSSGIVVVDRSRYFQYSNRSLSWDEIMRNAIREGRRWEAL